MLATDSRAFALLKVIATTEPNDPPGAVMTIDNLMERLKTALQESSDEDRTEAFKVLNARAVELESVAGRMARVIAAKIALTVIEIEGGKKDAPLAQVVAGPDDVLAATGCFGTPAARTYLPEFTVGDEIDDADARYRKAYHAAEQRRWSGHVKDAPPLEC